MRSPTPTMARWLMAAPGDLGRQCRRALDGATAAEERRGQSARLESIEETPKSRAHAVGEDLLLAHVAVARLDHAQDLADALALGVAVADLLLGALFEVDDQRDRH